MSNRSPFTPEHRLLNPVNIPVVDHLDINDQQLSSLLCQCILQWQNNSINNNNDDDDYDGTIDWMQIEKLMKQQVLSSSSLLLL